MKLTRPSEAILHALMQSESQQSSPKEVITQPMDEPAIRNSDRIAWLEKAYQVLRREFLPEAPERITIAFGFPSTGARKSKNRRLGEYADRFMQGYPDYPVNSGLISLHPTIFNDPSRVLDVLLHEMIHAATPGEGHRGMFRAMAKRVGLAGRMTATVAGPELKQRLEKLLTDHLTPMPPGYGDLAPERKKQATRMRKYVCPECGQIIRAATDDLYAFCGHCVEQFIQEMKEE